VDVYDDERLAEEAPPWPANEIAPGIWQSGHPEPGEQWDAVVDLDGVAPPLHDIAVYVHWPIPDGPAPDPAVLTALADLVNDLRRGGKRVLVHCFPTGTLVDGPVPAPIERAEQVIGHDGRLHKVIRRSSRPYAGPLVVLDATGSGPLRCTPEHPVLIVRPDRFPGGVLAKPGAPSWRGVGTAIDHYRRQPHWTEAANVQPGDFLVAPRPAVTADPVAVSWADRWHPNARQLSPLVPDDETAWMLGQYVADGGTHGQAGVAFTTSRLQDADRLGGIWQRMGARVVVLDRGTYQRVSVTSAAASRMLRAWCGSGDSRRLPAFVFDGWPLAPLVEGIVAADGHVDRQGRITVTTISPVLARQLHMILRMLGESPTLRPIRRTSGYPNAKPAEAVRWTPATVQRQTAWWRGLYLMPVREVREEPYRGQVHNLEVADAQTFTVAGATVHNCAAGINRSGLLAAAALIRDGTPPEEAIATVRERRMGALNNQEFVEQLRRDISAR
jgi:hypothetical protein